MTDAVAGSLGADDEIRLAWERGYRHGTRDGYVDGKYIASAFFCFVTALPSVRFGPKVTVCRDS